MNDSRPLGRLFRSRTMWVVLAVVAVALLAVGSVHPSITTPAQRIADLENLLKCPSCADASLAQSETVSANELKSTIASWVHQGLSDQVIEARMVASYGQGELLRPAGRVIWVVPVVVVLTALSALVLFFLRRRPIEAGVSKEDEAQVLALLKHRSEARLGEMTHED